MNYNESKVASVVIRGGVVALLLALSGCGFGPFPGGPLDGAEQPLSALDRTVLDEVSVVRLETRPRAPYSVHVQLFSVGDGLYLDPAPERRWLQFMDADPRVRIQFADDATIYRARAVREEDPAVLALFDDALVIVRLDSE